MEKTLNGLFELIILVTDLCNFLMAEVKKPLLINLKAQYMIENTMFCIFSLFFLLCENGRNPASQYAMVALLLVRISVF